MDLWTVDFYMVSNIRIFKCDFCDHVILFVQIVATIRFLRCDLVELTIEISSTRDSSRMIHFQSILVNSTILSIITSLR